MKKMLFLWLLLQPCFLLAWQGDVACFQYNNATFTLNAPAVADTVYLSTSSRAAVNANWQATVQLQYVPSSSNLARVYVMADTTCLTAPLCGYFVQIGGANKTIALYRQDETKNQLLLAAPDAILSQAPINVHIKVTRNQQFEWQLQYALDKGTWLSTTTILDDTYTQSRAWGFSCKFTKTRNTAFAFSNLSAVGDAYQAPVLPPIEQLYITEVLYDPFPDGVDFVELYNASDTIINLNRCVLSTGKKEVQLPAYSLYPEQYVAITSSDSILLEQYPDACYENFLQVPTLPNWVNDSGRVYLLSDAAVLDSMVYSDKMHHSQLYDAEGFSLERVPVDGVDWFSASSDVMATPGCSNSQSQILPDGSTESGIDKAFWLSDSWFAPQEQYLSIYHCVEEGTIANAWVYNLQGVPVYRLYNNTLLAAVGSTYWDGRDDAGEPCSVGIYMVVIEYITLSGKVNGVKIPVALGT